MDFTAKLLNNSDLQELVQKAGTNITSAIHQASTKTGVDFSYLMHQAQAESSFRSDIEAKTSSATGLYQFIEKTWLGMVRDHGDKYGLGEYAEVIDENTKVTDSSLEDEILELRKDPQLASLMAAEFAANNKEFLETRANLQNTEIGSTELYFAHFMGANGAKSFLEAHEQNPLAAGADLFPKEARANRGVFYDTDTGQSRTLAQIYDFFDKKFGSTQPASSEAANNNSFNTNTLLQAQEQAQAPSHSQYLRRIPSQEIELRAANEPSLPAIWNMVIERGGFHIRNEQQIGLDILNSLSTNPVETMILANLTGQNAKNDRIDQ